MVPRQTHGALAAVKSLLPMTSTVAMASVPLLPTLVIMAALLKAVQVASQVVASTAVKKGKLPNLSIQFPFKDID